MKEVLFSLAFLISFVLGYGTALFTINFIKKYISLNQKENMSSNGKTKTITKDVMSEWLYGESKGDVDDE